MYKHYSAIVRVIPEFTFLQFDDPVVGINNALNYAWGDGAWNGSVLVLADGIYNEEVHINGSELSVKIVPSPGATAIIKP
jgi:hypothetical protein